MNERPFVIGFANQDEGNPFAARLREHFEDEVSRIPEFKLVVRDNRMHTPTAIANATEFADMPVDLAILFHVDERAGSDITAPLLRRRIPVINIDIPLSKSAMFFGINAQKAGLEAGGALSDWVRAHWDGQIDKVLVLTDAHLLEVVKQRFDYALKALMDGVGYDPDTVLYVDTGSTPEISRSRVMRVLETWADVHHIAVLCLNDNVAKGALEAGRAAGRESDMAVLSYDGTDVALDEFRRPDSRLIVSPSFRPEEYAQKLCEVARRIKDGVRVPSTLVDPICLTRDNFRAFEA
jgi:ABC-type sugar transport system substrate-binding protein